MSDLDTLLWWLLCGDEGDPGIIGPFETEGDARDDADRSFCPHAHFPFPATPRSLLKRFRSVRKLVAIGDGGLHAFGDRMVVGCAWGEMEPHRLGRLYEEMAKAFNDSSTSPVMAPASPWARW